ncbi:hypothetical protein J3F83DRAFT_725367 [Trichoderma novae-zelandiae]
MGQLADIFLELHKYPFALLGVFKTPMHHYVGSFAGESLTNLEDFRDGHHRKAMNST